MTNLSLFKKILFLSSIWPCIEWGRCTSDCNQLVKGHLIIRELKQRAIREGCLDKVFSTNEEVQPDSLSAVSI